MNRWFACFLFLLPMAGTLQSQQPSREDNCLLVVRVRTSQEWRIENPIEVQVLVPQGIRATATLVDEASVQFQVASGKNYRLRVSGAGIKTVITNYFAIEALESEHTETVHVERSDPAAGTKPHAGAATISASELNVPKDAGAEMKKGLDAYAKADMKNAASHFEKAAAEYPHFARAYDLLASIAIRQGDRVKARDLFRKSIEADETYVPGYLDMARMDLQDKEYANAEALLKRAISMNPSLPEAVALLATTEFANNEYSQALADVERTHSLRGHEQFAEVHLMAGRVLAMQNQPDAAAAQFKLFLAEKPGSPEAAKARATLAGLAKRHP